MSESPRYLAPHLRGLPAGAQSDVAPGFPGSPNSRNRTASTSTNCYPARHAHGHVEIFAAEAFETFPQVDEEEFELCMGKAERSLVNTFTQEIKKVIETHRVEGVDGCCLRFENDFVAQNTLRAVAVRMVAAFKPVPKAPWGKRFMDKLFDAGRKVQARLSGAGDD